MPDSAPSPETAVPHRSDGAAAPTQRPRPNLHEYLEKRDFARTPEPGAEAPSPTPETGPLTFAIQKHAAQQAGLHYDLRLELGGALKSWAVPRGPSLDPNENRLAVMTEDHPMMYTSFEGVIPRDQYGGGEMIVFDRGTWAPEGVDLEDRDRAEARARETIERGRFSFQLHGQKIRGLFTLIRTKDRQWLLRKKKDAEASVERDPLADGRSVLSGLTIDDLRAGKRPARHSVLSLDERLRALPGARVTPPPEDAEPMFAASVEKPFDDARYLFEPKLDGYRVLAFVGPDGVTIRSRRGVDATDEYPGIADALRAQAHGPFVLDGEVVGLGPNGLPSFDILKERLALIRRQPSRAAAATIALVFYVFDVLHARGVDLRDVPLVERKAILRDLVTPGPAIQIVDFVEAAGTTMFQAAANLGLEGIVAKRLNSRYEPGRRSQSWLKVKTTRTDEFVVCGFTAGKGGRGDTFGALILGQYGRDGRLAFCGTVGSGFTDREAAEMRHRLDPLVVTVSPFHEDISAYLGLRGRDADATWVEPRFVVEVAFLEWTSDEKLRAPVFKRLRDDRTPISVRRAEIVAPPAPERDDELALLPDILEQLARPVAGLTLEIGPHRLPLTNLDKPLWPDRTKRDYLIYLARIAPVLLPHLKDRPLTLIRFPDGIDGPRFYQRHLGQGVKADFVEIVRAYSDHNGADEELIVCNNLACLLWLGQMAALEIHAWYSRTVSEPDGATATTTFGGSLEAMKSSLLNYPDFIVFDLDPVRPTDEPTPRFDRARFMNVCRGAVWLRELLDTMSLSSFVKTTGRSGLHVYVPLVRRFDYDQIRSISQTVAQFVKQQHPREIALEWAVQKRTGEVFVDTNQNVRGKTLASVYSPRATPQGTVSGPLRWDEVGKVMPTDLTLTSMPDRVRALGDLWAGALTSRNDLALQFGSG